MAPSGSPVQKQILKLKEVSMRKAEMLAELESLEKDAELHKLHKRFHDYPEKGNWERNWGTEWDSLWVEMGDKRDEKRLQTLLGHCWRVSKWPQSCSQGNEIKWFLVELYDIAEKGKGGKKSNEKSKNSVYDEIETAVESLEVSACETIESTAESLEKTAKSLKKSTSKTLQPVKEALEDLQTSTSNVVDSTAESFERTAKKLKKISLKTLQPVQEALEDLQTSVSEGIQSGIASLKRANSEQEDQSNAKKDKPSEWFCIKIIVS